MSSRQPSIIEESFSYYERLGRVRQYVESHLSDGVTSSAAAVVACLEPSYFSCYFRQRVGIGFTQWVRQRQIKTAQRLLEERDCVISEVAFTAGFRSVRTFERWFQRFVGVTPLDFKLRSRPSATGSSGSHRRTPMRRKTSLVETRRRHATGGLLALGTRREQPSTKTVA